MRERDGDRSARPRLTVARALGTMGDERITLAGEFDVYTGRAAAEELQPHDPRTRILELDLTRVTFIDATGIQAMVRALRRAWQLDYELRITGVSPAVARLLRLVGLRQLLPDALEAGGPRRRSARLGSGESSEVVALDRQRNTGPGLPTQHL